MIFGTKQPQKEKKSKIRRVQAQIGICQMLVSQEIIASLIFGVPDDSFDFEFTI